jgi:multidrug transporter EmrE-like cation transporter
MQAAAQVIFNYGSTAPPRFVPCFIVGNVFGASSIWLLMLLYKSMNPNLALGLGTGGGFLCAQGALALLFHTSLTPLQYAAILLVAVGMGLFAAVARTG